MPHLSPMNWLAAPIMFTLISLPLMMSYLWWAQTPSFPNIQTSILLNKPVKWNWL